MSGDGGDGYGDGYGVLGRENETLDCEENPALVLLTPGDGSWIDSELEIRRG